jgi:radical SAM superfamily enzyme with C-terminal helix-hairpin-helix motif
VINFLCMSGLGAIPYIHIYSNIYIYGVYKGHGADDIASYVVNDESRSRVMAPPGSGCLVCYPERKCVNLRARG